jgi:hypothetical protein
VNNKLDIEYNADADDKIIEEDFEEMCSKKEK